MTQTLRLVVIGSALSERREFAQLCADLNIECQSFASAEAGLSYLRQANADLVFVSETLPDNSPFELCRAIHQEPERQLCPVLLFSLDPHPELIAKAMGAGISDIFKLDQWDEICAYLQRIKCQHQPIEGRVLLVEDAVAIQRAVTAMLKPLGVNVVTAADVEGAWYYFQQQLFDLVIVDLVLEGDVSGLELINRIRRLDDSRGDLPIVVMSGYDDQARRIQLYRSGVSDFLHKPVQCEELTVRCRQLILNHQLRAQVAEQSKRLEANNLSLQRFLGRVSHECRNAINIVQGAAKRLRREPSLSERGLSLVDMIVRANEHQLSLVNDILDYSSLETGKLVLHTENFAVADLFDELAGLFAPRCEDKGIVFTTRVSAEVPERLQLDRRRLKQVLMNLIGNALKFTERGEIALSLELRDGRLAFTLSDTGMGIDQAAQQVIFDEFAQTEAGMECGGTGLGLAICSEIAQLLGGEMQVFSELGRGSVFTLLLPQQG